MSEYAQSILKRVLIIMVIGLVGYGLTRPPEQESMWLLCVWLAAVPATTAAILDVHIGLRVNDTQRSLQYLTIVLAMGFGMLSLQLLRH